MLQVVPASGPEESGAEEIAFMVRKERISILTDIDELFNTLRLCGPDKVVGVVTDSVGGCRLVIAAPGDFGIETFVELCAEHTRPPDDHFLVFLNGSVGAARSVDTVALQKVWLRLRPRILAERGVRFMDIVLFNGRSMACISLL